MDFKLSFKIPSDLNERLDYVVHKPFTKSEVVQAAIEQYLLLPEHKQAEANKSIKVNKLARRIREGV